MVHTNTADSLTTTLHTTITYIYLYCIYREVKPIETTQHYSELVAHGSLARRISLTGATCCVAESSDKKVIDTQSTRYLDPACD